MPEWLIGLCLCAGVYVAQDLVVFGAMWIVHRLWGVGGLAWVLGRTEHEVMQAGRPGAPKSGPKA